MPSARERQSIAVTPADGAPASDNPQAYIAEDRRRALARGEPLPDRVRGAALFADIAGSTPLTEAMVAELGSHRGAEALTSTLGVVFDAVLVELHRYGGSVIYFSGDAVTCWLDGDDGLLATDCGLAMQRAMATVSTVTLPSGLTIPLSMKVAIAVGPARRFVVGDPALQLIDVLAGALMDDLAGAEHAANTGEVVLDASALDSLGDRVEVAERRTSPGSRRAVAVVRSLTVVPQLPELPAEEPVLDEEAVRRGCSRRSTSGSVAVEGSSWRSCATRSRSSWGAARTRSPTAVHRRRNNARHPRRGRSVTLAGQPSRGRGIPG